MTVSLGQRLRDSAAAMQSERVSVACLLQAHGPGAHGSLLLLMTVPCRLPIPGTGTVLGFGVLAMAFAMWRGRPGTALPHRVAELKMSRAWARRVLKTLATVCGLAVRVTRVRRCWTLTAPARRRIAASVCAMAVLPVLPIPFGNVLPALALMLIGLGLVFRDGVLVVLGILTAGSTVALTLARQIGGPRAACFSTPARAARGAGNGRPDVAASASTPAAPSGSQTEAPGSAGGCLPEERGRSSPAAGSHKSRQSALLSKRCMS